MQATDTALEALNRMRAAMAPKERGKTQQLRDEGGKLVGHYTMQHVDLLPPDVVAICDLIIAAGKGTDKVRDLRRGARTTRQDKPCFLQADCAFHLLDLASTIIPAELAPPAEPEQPQDGTTVHDTEHAALPPLISHG